MSELNNKQENMVSDCLFCNIAKKIVGAKVVFENEYVVAFEDIHPVAPVHILVIPKIHIESANYITEENSIYVSKIFEAIPDIAKSAEIFDDGYRVISNVGENGGQLLKHLHFHIIGGKKLGPKIVHD